MFLTDSASSKTWMMAHDAIKERRLSFGFLPSRNSNGQKKTVFALHSDAPSESLIVNEDGHAVFSRSYNRKQEASTLVLRRARGKPGNPQIVTTGDEVGKLSFKGFNGVQHSPLADISGMPTKFSINFERAVLYSYWLCLAYSARGWRCDKAWQHRLPVCSKNAKVWGYRT